MVNQTDLVNWSPSLPKTNYKIIYAGVNHPKLEAFQKAVEATLKKRLQQAEEELDFLRKENVDKKQGRAQQTTALHETQRLLKLEQRKLKKVSEETQVIAKGEVFSKNSSNQFIFWRTILYVGEPSNWRYSVESTDRKSPKFKKVCQKGKNMIWRIF